MLTRIRNCEILKPIALILPKLQRIYEDNRSFPNGTDLTFKFKIFNMGVDFI